VRELPAQVRRVGRPLGDLTAQLVDQLGVTGDPQAQVAQLGGSVVAFVGHARRLPGGGPADARGYRCGAGRSLCASAARRRSAASSLRRRWVSANSALRSAGDALRGFGGRGEDELGGVGIATILSLLRGMVARREMKERWGSRATGWSNPTPAPRSGAPLRQGCEPARRGPGLGGPALALGERGPLRDKPLVGARRLVAWLRRLGRRAAGCV
jgi:hypothetical protein